MISFSQAMVLMLQLETELMAIIRLLTSVLNEQTKSLIFGLHLGMGIRQTVTMRLTAPSARAKVAITTLATTATSTDSRPRHRGDVLFSSDYS